MVSQNPPTAEQILDALIAGPGGLFTVDRDMRLTSVQTPDASHTEPDVGQRCYRARSGCDQPCPGCPVADALASGHVRHGRVRIEATDQWHELVAHPLRQPDGHVSHVVVSSQEVTAHVRGEQVTRSTPGDLAEQLRERQQQLEMILQCARDAISITKRDPVTGKRRLVLCNDSYVAMSGRSRDELMAADDLGVFTVTHDTTASGRDWRLGAARNQSFSGISSWLRPDGQVNYFEWASSPFVLEGEHYAVGIDRDMTERRRTEEALWERDRLLEMILQHASDGISITQFDAKTYARRLVLCNDRYAEMAGRSREELFACDDLNQFVANDLSPDEMQQLLNAVSRSEPLSGRSSWLRPDGKKNYFEWTAITIWSGEEGMSVGIDRDITERKRAEDRLRLLSSAVEQCREGIAVVDMAGVVLFCNQAFAASHDYTPDEVVGRHLSIFHTPEQMPDVEAANTRIGVPGEFDGEIWHARRDGTVFPGLMHNAILRDEAGTAIGVIGTLRDISDIKATQEALRDHGAFQAILAAIRGVQPEKDEAALWNAFLDAILKEYEFGTAWYGTYTDGHVTPTVRAVHDDTCRDAIVLDVDQPPRSGACGVMAQAILHRRPVGYTDLTEDDAFYPGCGSNLAMPVIVEDEVEGGVMLCAAVPNAFPPERVARLMLLVRQMGQMIEDRRQRQRAEAALHRAERRYRHVVENVPVILWSHDGARQDATLVSSSCVHVLGYTPDQFADDDTLWWRALHGEGTDWPEGEIRSACREHGFWSGETHMRHRDGSTRRMLHSVAGELDASGELVGTYGVAVDITDRWYLEVTNRMLLQIARLSVSAATEQEFLRRSLSVIRDDVSVMATVFYTYDPSSNRLMLRGFEGVPSTVFDRVGELRVEADACRICAKSAYQRRVVVRLDLQNDPDMAYLRKEVRELGLIGMVTIPLVVHDALLGVLQVGINDPNAISASCVQMFESIGHELASGLASRRAQASMAEAQRLKTLGTLAAGVAHDFNNILVAILGGASFIRARVPEPGQLAEATENVVLAAKRARSLVEQLLAFGQRHAEVPVRFDLNDAVRSAKSLVEPGLPSDITLKIDLADGLPEILAARQGVEQVIIDLALNARDAMPHGGALHIETGQTVLDHEHASPMVLDSRQPGPYVILTVRDTGQGMEEGLLNHIFDPFYTTKAGGHGLGLSAVHGIVSSHHGCMDVTSSPGEGTAFRILLPVAPPE